jgi:hypothetical protein
MKVKRPLPNEISGERRRELIVSAWRALVETSGETSLGAAELIAIQKAIAALVDEDRFPVLQALTRLPRKAPNCATEVIECDAAWRGARWEREAEKFKRLDDLVSDQPLTIKRAEELLAELDRLRQNFESTNDDEGLARLKEFALSAQRRSQAPARSGIEPAVLAEQTEIAAWLKVWIQTPAIFGDWLELRKRSVEFARRFHADNT